MGERVYVGRATPVEPVGEPDGAGAGAARRDPPLEYGRADRAGNAWRWARAWGAALGESVTRLTQLFVAVLGGWRRIVFALGLACLLGGLGDCLADYSRGDGAFWMFVGGLLIGLTVRVPLRGGSEA
jgi:hypothetical protein